MYLIFQYYLFNKEIKKHIFSICTTYEEAKNTLLKAKNIFPEYFIIIPGVSKKIKKNFLNFILNKNPEKCILLLKKND